KYLAASIWAAWETASACALNTTTGIVRSDGSPRCCVRNSRPSITGIIPQLRRGEQRLQLSLHRLILHAGG
ncbi:MAG TPA: hypothetical protein VKH65_13695, partial [Myxococcales bacterium]|nr:hypothetical protein [Myxococcales bacterium]